MFITLVSILGNIHFLKCWSKKQPSVTTILLKKIIIAPYKLHRSPIFILHRSTTFCGKLFLDRTGYMYLSMSTFVSFQIHLLNYTVFVLSLLSLPGEEGCREKERIVQRVRFCVHTVLLNTCSCLLVYQGIINLNDLEILMFLSHLKHHKQQ